MIYDSPFIPGGPVNPGRPVNPVSPLIPGLPGEPDQRLQSATFPSEVVLIASSTNDANHCSFNNTLLKF